ncbi:MAG: hypothetical protein E7480_08420 [Ruminococcaceae bacterium]|nr:hypothetical protein [Oscillospiraceae bacterium]
MSKFSELREKYPHFIYKSFKYEHKDDVLSIDYLFEISGLCEFTPHWEIPCKSFKNSSEIEKLVFSLGMAELVSYWKITCSPLVTVEAGFVDSEMVKWWKKLYFHGLGEFFYVNKIDADPESFMQIESKGQKITVSSQKRSLEGALIPVGGGKDSAVSIELLKASGIPLQCYIINPRKATLDTVRVSGLDSINVKRTLDKNMLELNKQGFLNGHTPFSAIVAFSSVLTAFLNNKKYVALSNEASANESTVLNSTVNHQYSKSLEFERDLRNYQKKYIDCEVEYFSFLRPLCELQIAGIFSKLTKYHDIFRSCNVGSKTDIWCAKCAKCLFVYIILSPFMSEKELTCIFGANLLDDISLKPLFDGLIGKIPEKPFECVGSRDEINAAICMTIKKSTKLPALLEYYKSLNKEESFVNLKQYQDDCEFPEDIFATIIKREVDLLD